MSGTAALEDRLALVFTPASRRAAVEALDTVIDEISASLVPTLDHTVAHTRLVWWREEVLRLVQGAPLHPATRRLHAEAPNTRFQRLESLLTAAEYHLAGHQPADTRELTALFARLHGVPEVLRAEVLHGGPEPRLETFGLALGEVFGYTACLSDASGDDARGYARALREALARLAPSKDLATAERPGLIRAALIAERLTDHGLTATPGALRALYIAWRCARRHRLELR
jgi:phytoene synthase